MTTLENSYCVPSTGEEWDMLAPYFPEEVEDYGSVNYWRADYIRCGYINLIQVDSGLMLVADIHDLTKIPVPHFLDLLHDRIVPWRLEEVGFEIGVRDYSRTVGAAVLGVEDGDVEMWHNRQRIAIPLNITTFTDLLTLIRMLTPPPEET